MKWGKQVHTGIDIIETSFPKPYLPLLVEVPSDVPFLCYVTVEKKILAVNHYQTVHIVFHMKNVDFIDFILTKKSYHFFPRGIIKHFVYEGTSFSLFGSQRPPFFFFFCLSINWAPPKGSVLGVHADVYFCRMSVGPRNNGLPQAPLRTRL